MANLELKYRIVLIIWTISISDRGYFYLIKDQAFYGQKRNVIFDLS